MNFKKITAFVTSVLIYSFTAFSSISFAQELYTESSSEISDVTNPTDTVEPSTEENSVYTVTFLDYSGNVLNTQEVTPETMIDYSLIDTTSSQLNYNVDTFNQIKFHSWDIQPETVQEDTIIQALGTKLSISLDSIPEKNIYHSMNETIDTSGLIVNITIFTPSNEFDENNNRIYISEITDVSSSCTLSFDNTSTAFESSNTAEIKIFPIGSSVAVGSYQISFEPLMGDVNLDGQINSSDASDVLLYYATTSMGFDGNFNENQKKVSDVNNDLSINSSDSSDILAYYAETSAGNTPEWNQK